MLRAGALGGLSIALTGSIDAIAAPRAAAVTRRSAGYGAVHGDIAWAKLAALVEGAGIASKRL